MKWPWALGVSLAVGALVAAWLILRRGPAAEAFSAHGELSSSANPVAANGVVEGARPEVALRPETDGTIAAIPYRENREVTAGTILVELENSTQKQQIALAKAELAVARAGRAASLAVYQQTAKECRRARELRYRRAISPEQYDAVYYRMVQFKAQWAAAVGRVRMAQARLELASTALEKTRLRAPTRGHVLRVHAEVGELAGPKSARPILVFADLSRRRVRTFIDELDAARVELGQSAVITCDALPGKEFHGTVRVVLPRMGKRALATDAADEYRDVYVREVMIDLVAGQELLLNIQVKVHIFPAR
jgi:RND family efflux transporter MFP subunit